MPMRKTQTRARRLRTGPTSRPSDLVLLLFSRRNCDAASDFVQAYFVRRFKTQIRHFAPPRRLSGLIRPEEMLQPKIGKPPFCFFAPAASRRSEFLIDRSSRFPL
jgi:hypothetical protein